MASPIADSWVYATMMIENEIGERGTGFLVQRVIDKNNSRIFLATNKHVLHKKTDGRKNASKLLLHLNIKKTDGSINAIKAETPLIIKGAKIWREHPNKDVDVLAIDVTHLIVEIPQVEKKWATYELFVDKKKLEELDITIAEEILVIGYPLGIRHATTNFPLVRSGIIATRIGENIEDEVPIEKDDSIEDEVPIEEDDSSRKKYRTRLLRGFLVDGAIIPGSSGSPVVLKQSPARFTKNGVAFGSPPPPVLLGIVAETRFAPIRISTGSIPSFAGLGLAFDAETIRETIELFFISK